MRETADQWKSIFVDYRIDRFSLNSNQRRHESCNEKPDARSAGRSEGCVRSDETNLAPNESRRRVLGHDTRHPVQSTTGTCS